MKRRNENRVRSRKARTSRVSAASGSSRASRTTYSGRRSAQKPRHAHTQLRETRNRTPHLLWLGAFSVWIALLSGYFSDQGESPGIRQAVVIHQMLESRKAELARSEGKILELERQKELLKTSAITQERAIRNILGLAAANELIFEF